MGVAAVFLIFLFCWCLRCRANRKQRERASAAKKDGAYGQLDGDSEAEADARVEPTERTPLAAPARPPPDSAV